MNLKQTTAMKINEIFYSLQGEGRWTGTPAIFIRFSGCNLRCCFCDTKFDDYKILSVDEIIEAIADYPANHVVLTGGEPTLQITRTLIERLHDAGYYVQIETNGTVMLKNGLETLIDWITCSPKYADVRIQRFDELKVVYQRQDMSQYLHLKPTFQDCLYLQPCDCGNEALNIENVKDTIKYIKSHPEWKLSLQTHKILNVR